MARLRLCAGLLVVAICPSLILADGPLTTTPPSFMGYYDGPERIEPLDCPKDAKFTTSGTRAQCCYTNGQNPCSFNIACLNNVVTFANSQNFTCEPGFSCVAMTHYESTPRASKSWTQAFCGRNWAANTVFMQYPGVTTTSSSSSSQPASTSVPSSTASLPPQTSAPNPPPEAPAAVQSQAWIAGPVIGGVVAIVGVAAAFFWLKRRTKAKDQEAMSMSTASNYYQHPSSASRSAMPPPSTLGPKSPDYYGNGTPHWQAAEMDSTVVSPAARPLQPQQYWEMDGGGAVPHSAVSGVSPHSVAAQTDPSLYSGGSPVASSNGYPAPPGPGMQRY